MKRFKLWLYDKEDRRPFMNAWHEVKEIGVAYDQALTFVLEDGREMEQEWVELGEGWYGDARKEQP